VYREGKSSRDREAVSEKGDYKERGGQQQNRSERGDGVNRAKRSIQNEEKRSGTLEVRSHRKGKGSL